MIVPDVGLLVHAHNRGSRVHDPARAWWSHALSGDRSVGLPWAVLTGFIRAITHPGIAAQPVSVVEANALVRSWLDRPPCGILLPGERHATILFGLLESLGTAGALTATAHLAALAIEHQAELHATDVDYARFAGLKWRNPLEM